MRGLVILGILWTTTAFLANAADFDPVELAQQVEIFRDEFGQAHIDGATDAAVFFGFGYVQAEDYFWQVEDNFLLGLGRYAEAHGKTGLNSDLLNRAWEVPTRSKVDFEGLDDESKIMCTAFITGINYYLETHPEVRPRLIQRFEPWHVIALCRQCVLEMCYRRIGVGKGGPRHYDEIYTARGSNAFALAPSKTKSGNTMLVINPHQPWFGFGQMYEGHLRSREGDGWHFTGATFLGAPILLLGHNEHLGWALTTNMPDCGDAWRVTFDDPARPLAYRYGNGYREAVEWTDTIRFRRGDTVEEQRHTFRKTHWGPVLQREDDDHYLCGQIAKFNEAFVPRQMLAMMRARNLPEFKAAVDRLEFQYQNITYADRAGNIYYLYNGVIPRRDPQFDWNAPLDGSDPRTEWKGFHPIDELPWVLNPVEGYVQNCNSTPFTTCDNESPHKDDFPKYMAVEKDFDNRRAHMCRKLLREVDEVDFDKLQSLIFDTTIYWALSEIPRYRAMFSSLEQSNSQLAAEIKPLLDHFDGWDYKVTYDSTQATLCHAWFEELYGVSHPAEVLKPEYQEGGWEKRFEALAKGARKLEAYYGSWKVQWRDIYRIQRAIEVVDMLEMPFDDARPSLPSLGVPGPMGVFFTLHYTPAVRIPLVKTNKLRYAIVGISYVSGIEFGDRIQAGTLVPFGTGVNSESPHHMDQARLLSETRLREQHFYWEDVKAAAKTVYRPGEKPTAR